MTLLYLEGTPIIEPSGVFHELPRTTFQKIAAKRMNKFGYNGVIDTNTDPEDIWDVGGLHPGVQTAAAATVESSDGDDDAASGQGAWTVTVTYQDSNGGEITETVTMDGTQPQTLSRQATCIYRMKVLTAGSNGPNVGNLIAKISTTVVAQINILEGQTLMAWYCVPKDHTAYMLSFRGSIGKKTSTVATMSLRAKENGGQLVVKERFSLHSGSVPYEQTYLIPPAFESQTTLVIRCEEVSASATDVSAGFDLLVLPNKDAHEV